MVESDRLAGRGYRVASVRSRSARPARAFHVPGHVTAHRPRHGTRSRGRRPMTRREFIRVLAAGTREAHALTHLDFARAAAVYGRVGGFAHLATLVKRLRAGRPGALLLDAGDTWQGSATALWTRGQDMVDAARALGVDVMTGHWEFTHGAARVREIVEGDLKGRVDFVAHNVKTLDFGDPVFSPYALRAVNGVAVAVIGQPFPYTPIANPRYLVPEWTFGIQEEHLQKTIDDARRRGARAIVLLSHNRTDADLKLAGRVRGLDAILGGHTHDGL